MFNVQCSMFNGFRVSRGSPDLSLHLGIVAHAYLCQVVCAARICATQINTLLTDKANKSSTYTKTEVDNLIASNNNVYTKAEVDALLANAGGDTSNFYTKAEIDEMLGDIESGSY